MFWNRRRTLLQDQMSGGCSMRAALVRTVISGIALSLLGSNAAAIQSLLMVQNITPENANTLDVDISSRRDGNVTLVTMIGPMESKEGCPPRRTGTFLLDSDGNELSVFIAELNSSSSKPEVIGYYTTESQSMGVFIDYLCGGEGAYNSRRYSVESVADFLKNE